jgi:aspartate carbamoyltransferase regulatory subunit
MYQIRLSDTDENKLIYYCASCGNTDSHIQSKTNLVDVCVSTVQHRHIINEYTKFDPTLPRIEEKMLCPNQECLTNAEKDRADQEIIKICYDETNKKYVYLCAVCDEAWELTN